MGGPTPGTTFRVGLTGGVASGKSTVAGLFSELGVPVIDTDVIAREVVAPGEPALDRIVEAFGRDMLAQDGSLDRRRMRALVFADAAERKRLEHILHPAIRAQMERQLDASPGPYQIVVIPLLVETGFEEAVNRVLVVDCPEAVQVERLRRRDGVSQEVARRMLDAQVSRATRLAAADDTIVNDSSRAALTPKVRAMHAEYLRLARHHERDTAR